MRGVVFERFEAGAVAAPGRALWLVRARVGDDLTIGRKAGEERRDEVGAAEVMLNDYLDAQRSGVDERGESFDPVRRCGEHREFPVERFLARLAR